MTKTNLEIEEEWNLAYSSFRNPDEMAKWWLSKLQQRMDEIEEAVKDIKAYREDSMEDRWVLLKEVLSIIKKTNE